MRGAAHVARDRVAQLAVARRAAGPRSQAGRDRGAVDDAGERHARQRVEPGEGVAAHRPRVGGREDDRAAAAVGVPQRRVEQLAPDALRLAVRVHAEQAQAPDPLAHQGEREPDDARPRRRRPSARGIGSLQMRDPVAPTLDPLRVARGLGELRRDLRLQRRPGHVVGGGDVVGCHRADQHRLDSQSINAGRVRPVVNNDRLPFCVPWPSPSRSSRTRRTTKRRSQHKISAAVVQRVPAVPQPPPPAPRLPHVRLLRRAVRSSRPSRATTTITITRPWPLTVRPSLSRSTPTARISVPPRSPRAPRSPPRRACACCCSGPPTAIGDVADGVEVVDAPVSIAKAADPVSAVRSTPDASIVQAARAVADGRRRRRSSPAARPARRSPPACSTSSARAAIFRPGARDPAARPRHAGHAARRRRQRRGRGREHLVQFAFMGAALRAGRARRRARRASALLSNGEEAMKGTPLVLEAHAAARATVAGVRVRRQRRGHRPRPRAPPT